MGYFQNIIASKQELSDLSSYINANWGLDLWSLLKNGTPIPILGSIFPTLNTGLSVYQLAQIIKVVNGYPDVNTDAYSLNASNQ